jgi:hypothetical protein
MQDVIKKLTAEQALEVVKRLSGTEGKIQEAVLGEARDVLRVSSGPRLPQCIRWS